MEYRGYEIVEVFCYTNGKSDFEVYKGEFEGWFEIRTTIETIKKYIDELLTEA